MNLEEGVDVVGGRVFEGGREHISEFRNLMSTTVIVREVANWFIKVGRLEEEDWFQRLKDEQGEGLYGQGL